MSKSTSKSQVIKRIFRSSCIIYTVIALFLCLILMMISEDLSKAISPKNFLLIFPFSVCLATANLLDKSSRLAQFYKSLLHAGITLGGFFLFLYLPAFRGTSDSNFFVVLLVFVVCYALIYGLTLLFRYRIRKEFGEETEYKPQFSAKDASKK